MKKVSIILGTRPEAVKLCPLILAMQDFPRLAPHVCVTGQHREMLDQVLKVFGVTPDVDLGLMRCGQSLADLTARVLSAVDRYLDEHQPDLVLVQGDTTTVLAASLAAFYRQIKIAHVEAGLRTLNKHSPFPEEINRTLTSRLADYHFAPTGRAKRELLRERIAENKIFVTGNTAIDALRLAVEKTRKNPPRISALPPDFFGRRPHRRLVLVTAHRRENIGRGMESICRAISILATRFGKVDFVYPVHSNPKVCEPVYRLLANRENVYLTEPLSYLPFVRLMDRATIVLTDSGGVQEEAPSLGKPVLVMRGATERIEGIEAGVAELVGTDTNAIVSKTSRLLTDSAAYDAMAHAVNPYGDGRASRRILSTLERCLSGQPPADRVASITPFLTAR